MKTSYKKKNNSAAAVIVIALLVIILAAAFIFAFGGSDNPANPFGIGDDVVGKGNGTDNGTRLNLLSESDLPDATLPVQETNETGNTSIVFNGSQITADGSGVLIEGSTVKIVKGGVYSLTGTLDDGQILVRAQGEDVVLILNGVNVTCSNCSPLHVNKAESVTLLLNGTTENVFTDGSVYDFTREYTDTTEGEPDACIFSRADLIIRGTGSLKVNANYNSGIIGKDTLQILNTTVDVTAKNNGINGKDSLTIENSTVRVTAGGDALRSTKDTDASLGWGLFRNSNIYLTATDGDGVQTETGITVDNCSISVLTGNSGYQSASTQSSTKGLKVNQGGINVTGGTLLINTYDDGLHCTGDITISGGTFSIATADDAVHSDNDIYVSGGTVVIPNSHEGLEAAMIDVSGGEVYINANDDGINASGGNDMSGQDNMFMSDGSSLNISGGYVYINSLGDGIDSNGDISMVGGTLIVSGPTSSADGAIDYNGNFYMDGGVLWAAGASQMAQAPDSLSQNALSITFDSAVKAGTYISISGDDKEFVFKVEKETANIIFSSPELQTGVEYTVSYGGKYSGEDKEGVCAGGKYSGGTELTKVTLTDGLNSYGRVGVGGSMGGGFFGDSGQFGGGFGFKGDLDRGFGNPGGGRGYMPPDGGPQEPPQGGMRENPSEPTM